MNDDVVTITDLDEPTAARPVVNVATPVDADVAVIKPEVDDSKKLPERAIEHEDGSIELPLFVPVVLRWRKQGSDVIETAEPVTSVTFRRLSGKQVRVIMNAGIGDAFWNELTHAAVVVQFPNKQKWLNTLDRMDGADSAGCMKIAQHFLENGPRTPGPRSSPS